ncbi:unnamed protein product [Caenorhabditis sp. 36 PRJEB53466]|nr:unnamed protein product [Caenorhabditis sp. 36 PRJEB53466]
MMVNQVRVLSTGTTDNGTIQYEEVDETKRWFNRRFCFLSAIGLVAVILAMVVILIVVLLLTQLKEANANAESVMTASKTQFEELSQKLQQPLEQLGPTLDRLANMPLPGGVPLPTQAPKPAVSPINPIVTGPETTPEPPRRSPKARYEWKGCENLGKCQLSGYTKPPLVILSLDGFAREYVDRDIVQTLNHIADCGVKADRVYPSFPSKTFPNHYSIVTGLYPESHGITDNSVFDPTISPALESMKSTKYAKYFVGEPIWSVYKRKTGNKANCLFWVGCAYNNSGYPPDVAPEYNQELPFRNRIDMVIDWLKLPADERPGLITAYLHEPDNAGHYQVDEEDVDEKLAEIDDNLDYLMSRLSEENLLECINFAILSDHGMQLIDKTYYFQDFLDLSGLVTAKGVVGRMYINDSNISVEDVADKFRCKIDTVKANTRADLPTRKHYSRSDRVGEVILEGRAGVTFYKSLADDYELSGDHGYDYFNPKMHTIFFARGPSFKQNYTIPPYQNVQYMNLWMNLLGIEGAVETNGTVGFFDEALTSPPRRDNPTNIVAECPMAALPSALKCSGDVSADTLSQLSSKLTSCAFSPTNLPLYSDSLCFQSYCENSVVVNRNGKDARRAIIEVLSRDEVVTPANYTFVNAKYQYTCPTVNGSSESITILKTSQMSSMADAQVTFPNNFILKVLDPLQAKSVEYLNKFGKMYVISGTATDANHDGVADASGTKLTHFYRIFLTCSSNWLSMNPPLCTDSEAMQTLAFIFPIVEQSTMDCMESDAILLDYTATIFDVERIAGFQFGLGALSQQQNVSVPRKYSWAGCENLQKCELDGYQKPPLMILSFDGFAREYLGRNIVDSLEKIAECGAKADRVYPSFPSKTFPNHYTMMTGLYPESHGITDNNVYDPEISPKLVAMRAAEAEQFYGGEPIWSAYKRLTGERAHCLFWVGCYFNNTGFMPDVSPDYNQELPLQDRIDTLVEWLKLPSDERPGLITAYLHQPDSAGHAQKDVNKALEDVDKYIDTLMTTLYEERLLECINLVIVSDHGMQALNNTVNVKDYINIDGRIFSNGVVARLHLNSTDLAVNDVADQMRCKVDGVKLNTVKDIPVRKHYSKTGRVGDIIIEGRAGTTFLKSDTNLGDHGYDYLNENMHTVMFARGPSFRQNVTVPPFQNVQYMNLWLSLLGIEGAVENNGTIGFFDSILERPPTRENNWNTVEECPNFGSTETLECYKIPDTIRRKISSRLETCSQIKDLPIYSKDHCFQSYCDNSIIASVNKGDCRKAVVEMLTSSETEETHSFNGETYSFLNTKYNYQCPNDTRNLQFFSAGIKAISHIADAQFNFPTLFLKNVLAPLQDKTSEYLQRFGKLFVLSGTATDANNDGIADKDGDPTHFYRILFTCTGTWLSFNPPLCRKISEMRALAFVFPILDRKSTMDCMSSDAVLLDYTATIQDVERIAGFQFQIGALSPQQNVYLRRNITLSLW